MPTYEYRCKECGTEFEKTLRFSEANQLPVCPHCNSPSTRKKLSTVSISFGTRSSTSSSTSGSSCSTSSGFS